MTREEQKKLLAKDLHVIVTMSSEYDMSNKKLRGQVRAVLVKKNSLKTKVGDLYLKRLSKLDEGLDGATCILCNKEKAVDGILCDSCMSLYTKGRLTIKKPATVAKSSASAAEKETPSKETPSKETPSKETPSKEIPSKEIAEQKAPGKRVAAFAQAAMQPISRPTVQPAEAPKPVEPARVVTTKAEQPKPAESVQPIEPAKTEPAKVEPPKPVQPAEPPKPAEPKKVIHLKPINKIDPDAEPAFPDVEVRKEKLLSEKQITRLVWFGCVILVLSLLATYLILSNKTISVKDADGVEFVVDPKTKGNVKDLNEAEKLVYKEFPGSDGWEIFSHEESTTPMGWSWTPVGYSVGNAKNVLPTLVDEEYLVKYDEKELCWVFRMKKAKERTIIGKVYVNCRGMVFLEGEFEQCPISDYIYRVK